MSSFENDVAWLLDSVDEASHAVMEVYEGGDVSVIEKADGSPLTQADLASNAILTRALTEIFPEIPIVSEEAEDQELNRRIVAEADSFWLVDPLDGTREFVERSGEFTVCLALIENGVATFGVVSAPVLDTVYYGGTKLGGSFKEVGDEPKQPISVQRNSPGIVVCSRSFLNDSTQAYVDQHYPGYTQKQIGSQLKLPMIAEGAADVCPRLDTPQHLWDVAAGHAILSAAGGTVQRFDGTAMNYRDTSLLAGDFIASN